MQRKTNFNDIYMYGLSSHLICVLLQLLCLGESLEIHSRKDVPMILQNSSRKEKYGKYFFLFPVFFVLLLFHHHYYLTDWKLKLCECKNHSFFYEYLHLQDLLILGFCIVQIIDFYFIVQQNVRFSSAKDNTKWTSIYILSKVYQYERN